MKKKTIAISVAVAVALAAGALGAGGAYHHREKGPRQNHGGPSRCDSSQG